MKRRSVYSIIAIIILIGVFTYEYILTDKDHQDRIEEGALPKAQTNRFFLPSSTTGQIVHHNYYSLSYSEPYEQAEWVAYELKASHLSKINHKRPYFEVDKAVKTGAAHWRNYKNSGYDRGHLCPAGDRRFSKSAHDETFLTSNITPQQHDFNSGIWNRLEQKVRYWAQKYDGVYVVTGGVLKPTLGSIGFEGVEVPDQFYKIVLDYNNGRPKAIAFLLPHEDSDAPLYEFVVHIDDVETLTGIDFFPQLDDEVEHALEASNNYKDWSF